MIFLRVEIYFQVESNVLAVLWVPYDKAKENYDYIIWSCVPTGLEIKNDCADEDRKKFTAMLRHSMLHKLSSD
jgi:hypothetical protein